MKPNTVPIFINRRKIHAPPGPTTGRDILALVDLGEGYDLKLLRGEGDPSGGECILADQIVHLRPGLHFRAVPGNCTFGSGDIPGVLQRDAAELSQEVGCAVRLLREGRQVLVIVQAAALPPGHYNHATSDILMITDVQYPASAIDMFYLEKHIALNGQAIPRYASHVEQHGGRSWRRWSWHRNGTWKPGVDGLLSHWAFIEECWSQERKSAPPRVA